MATSKIGRRGQTTIPGEIRKMLNLKEGNRVAFVRRGSDIVIQPLTSTLLDLRGSIPVSGPQDFTAIRKEVFKRHNRKASRDES